MGCGVMVGRWGCGVGCGGEVGVVYGVGGGV